MDLLGVADTAPICGEHGGSRDAGATPGYATGAAIDNGEQDHDAGDECGSTRSATERLYGLGERI